MKIELWCIGKTKDKYLEEGIEIYEQRLQHYVNFDFKIIPDVKNGSKMTSAKLKQKEAELVLSRLVPGDNLILLDERGKTHSSESFAYFLQDQMNQSVRKIIFLIGGAFGFDKSLYQRSQMKISLSAMTFSHQMVRLFFVEQVYRAYTILRNEKYHNH